MPVPVQGPAPEQLLLVVAFGTQCPLGHSVSAVQKQLVCDASHVSAVLWKPAFAGHEYVVVPVGSGIPGLASSQSKPSRLPVPLQPVPRPQETSFSPVILTHLPLLHWVSSTQKQPPPPAQVLLVLPLQLPTGHVYPLGVELGQPPSWQGTGPASTTPASPPGAGPESFASVPASAIGAWQLPETQVVPPVHAWAEPQPPQLLLSVCSSTQAPEQAV